MRAASFFDITDEMQPFRWSVTTFVSSPFSAPVAEFIRRITSTHGASRSIIFSSVFILALDALYAAHIFFFSSGVLVIVFCFYFIGCTPIPYISEFKLFFKFF